MRAMVSILIFFFDFPSLWVKQCLVEQTLSLVVRRLGIYVCDIYLNLFKPVKNSKNMFYVLSWLFCVGVFLRLIVACLVVLFFSNMWLNI